MKIKKSYFREFVASVVSFAMIISPINLAFAQEIKPTKVVNTASLDSTNPDLFSDNIEKLEVTQEVLDNIRGVNSGLFNQAILSQDGKEYYLVKGQKITLLDKNNGNYSTKTGVVKVSKKGVASAKNIGRCTIANDSVSINICVIKPIISLRGSEWDNIREYKSEELTVGDTRMIEMYTTNYDSLASLGIPVDWKSSNSKVAFVRDGMLYAASVGKAKITGYVNNKPYTVDLEIKGDGRPSYAFANLEVGQRLKVPMSKSEYRSSDKKNSEATFTSFDTNICDCYGNTIVANNPGETEVKVLYGKDEYNIGVFVTDSKLNEDKFLTKGEIKGKTLNYKLNLDLNQSYKMKGTLFNNPVFWKVSGNNKSNTVVNSLGNIKVLGISNKKSKANISVLKAKVAGKTYVITVEVSDKQYDQIEKVAGKYLVVFDSDGGSEVTSQAIEKGGKVRIPNAPVKEGYAFVGWEYMDAEYDFDKKVESDMILKAQWEKKARTVRVLLGKEKSNRDENEYIEIPVSESGYIDKGYWPRYLLKENVSKPTLEQAGKNLRDGENYSMYVFMGWANFDNYKNAAEYWDEDTTVDEWRDSDEFKWTQKIEYDMIIRPVYLFVGDSAITLSVDFVDANGDKIDELHTTVTKGEITMEPSLKYTQLITEQLAEQGYYMDGWKPTYEDNKWEFEFDYVLRNTTFEPNKKEIDYNIVYDLNITSDDESRVGDELYARENSRSNERLKINKTFGTQLVTPLADTRDGYRFKRWIDKNGNEVTSGTTLSSSMAVKNADWQCDENEVDTNKWDVVLRADWEQTTASYYQVKFRDGNGDIIDELTLDRVRRCNVVSEPGFEYTEMCTNQAAQLGMYMDGWVDEGKSGNDKVEFTEYNILGSTVFKPRLLNIEYEINFDLNLGTTTDTEEIDREYANRFSRNGSKKINEVYGTKIVANPPTRTGYDFLGWYDSKGNKIEADSVVQHNIAVKKDNYMMEEGYSLNTNAWKIVLRAKWKKAADLYYTVKFLDLDGNEIDELEQHIIANGWAVEPSNSYMRDFLNVLEESGGPKGTGKTSPGWYDTDGSGGVVDFVSYHITKDTTFAPLVEPLTYKTNYNFFYGILLTKLNESAQLYFDNVYQDKYDEIYDEILEKYQRDDECDDPEEAAEQEAREEAIDYAAEQVASDEGWAKSVGVVLTNGVGSLDSGELEEGRIKIDSDKIDIAKLETQDSSGRKMTTEVIQSQSYNPESTTNNDKVFNTRGVPDITDKYTFYAYTKILETTGLEFVGWMDQNSEMVYPSTMVTHDKSRRDPDYTVNMYRITNTNPFIIELWPVFNE